MSVTSEEELNVVRQRWCSAASEQSIKKQVHHGHREEELKDKNKGLSDQTFVPACLFLSSLLILSFVSSSVVVCLAYSSKHKHTSQKKKRGSEEGKFVAPAQLTKGKTSNENKNNKTAAIVRAAHAHSTTPQYSAKGCGDNSAPISSGQRDGRKKKWSCSYHRVSGSSHLPSSDACRAVPPAETASAQSYHPPPDSFRHASYR
jgi:cytoskeletal protein RodZ